MMRVYNALLLLALPLVLGRLLWRCWREPAYRARLGERFGGVPQEAVGPADAVAPEETVGPIWFHAVSAGEVNAAAPIIRAMHERLPPRQPLLVTTTTPAGSARVHALLGDITAHCYAPYDFPWAVRRFLRRTRPKALLLMETELWPNTIAQAAAGGTPIYLVNARLSDRAYRRYRRVRGLIAPTLGRLAGALCQYQDTAERLRALGAGCVEVTGSVKFDAELPADGREREPSQPPTWIAGSTHEGEETVVLDAHRRLRQRCPRLRLLLVPRHPARVPAVARLVRQRGFSVVLASAGTQTPHAAVVIGDVMGTLAGLYGEAQVAFVGGSLEGTGGHNPIEAAAQGVPFLMGPDRFKIEEIWQRFADAECCYSVRNAADVAATVAALLADPERRAEAGRRAQAVVAANRGATRIVVDRLCGWIEAGRG